VRVESWHAQLLLFQLRQFPSQKQVAIAEWQMQAIYWRIAGCGQPRQKCIMKMDPLLWKYRHDFHIQGSAL